MNDAMHRGEPVVALDGGPAKKRRRGTTFCSVCDNRIWFGPIQITEPEGVPEPRLSWVLCKECHGILLTEVRRSPLRSPLRLRVAMGLIASERWPHAYPSDARQRLSDYRWIVFIALGTFIAMLLHLVLIVLIAGFK
jgi:hypothetical protein